MAERFIIHTHTHICERCSPVVQAHCFSYFKVWFSESSAYAKDIGKFIISRAASVCVWDDLGWGLRCWELHRDTGTHLSQHGWVPRLSNRLAKQRSQLCWLKATQWYLITHTRRERGEFSVNSFEAIILIKRCRGSKAVKTEQCVAKRSNTSCGMPLCKNHSANGGDKLL